MTKNYNLLEKSDVQKHDKGSCGTIILTCDFALRPIAPFNRIEKAELATFGWRQGRLRESKSMG